MYSSAIAGFTSIKFEWLLSSLSVSLSCCIRDCERSLCVGSASAAAASASEATSDAESSSSGWILLGFLLENISQANNTNEP